MREGGSTCCIGTVRMLLSQRTHLLHGTHDNNSSLDGLGWCSHGYRCWGNGHGDRPALLTELTGLGEDRRCGRSRRRRRRRGRLGGQGEVEQGQRDRLLVQSCPLPSVLLLAGDSVLHFDARVHRLVAPQVVAVFELLVACGTDVSWPAGFGDWFHWNTQREENCQLSLLNVKRITFTIIKVN